MAMTYCWYIKVSTKLKFRFKNQNQPSYAYETRGYIPPMFLSFYIMSRFNNGERSPKQIVVLKLRMRYQLREYESANLQSYADYGIMLSIYSN
ncbi:hypothetical protein VNO77_27452 [Canavalia gladiata]|uniref:Uncharacterized protein n=1 Tax=Canavalia gladiata TaxID=3824 RepID=A0AAN9KXW2_CANGL